MQFLRICHQQLNLLVSLAWPYIRIFFWQKSCDWESSLDSVRIQLKFDVRLSNNFEVCWVLIVVWRYHKNKKNIFCNTSKWKNNFKFMNAIRESLIRVMWQRDHCGAAAHTFFRFEAFKAYFSALSARSTRAPPNSVWCNLFSQKLFINDSTSLLISVVWSSKLRQWKRNGLIFGDW